MENKNLHEVKIDNLPDEETQRKIVAEIQAEEAALKEAVEEGRMTKEEMEEQMKAVLAKHF